MFRLNSFLGLFVLLFIVWCLSGNRRKIDWRLVITGVILQFLLALLLIKTTIG
ncbi:MAG: hypothetical protein IKW74_03760 [Thermoguttaceae bacterium]|nr:hypothetical protein [Thermoguttaceae bacterium]